MAVVSFCLLSVLALLPLGLSTTRDSLEKTTAATITGEISSDFRQPWISTVTGTVTVINTPRFQISTAAGTSALYFGGDDSYTNVTGGATVTKNWLYRATVTVGATPANSSNTVPIRIFVTWPALADPNPTIAPVKYTGSLETITAVNNLSP